MSGTRDDLAFDRPRNREHTAGRDDQQDIASKPVPLTWSQLLPPLFHPLHPPWQRTSFDYYSTILLKNQVSLKILVGK